jgi:hypothetical protein
VREDRDSFARLWWIPVGAGGRVVIHTSRGWEAWAAHRERRAPRQLFHAALEVFDDGERFAIEMTPVLGGPRGDRGVVATGPVGARVLGVTPLFRYEVRCWRDGVIPDLGFAVGPAVDLPLTHDRAAAMLRRLRDVPRYTWGRDVLGTGDMWNSNSLVSWLLSGAGCDAAELLPPPGGHAPGWSCGMAASRAGG